MASQFGEMRFFGQFFKILLFLRPGADVLRDRVGIRLSQRSAGFDADAGALDSGQTLERVYVPLNQISPNLRLAVIASEDAPFCHHHGVDWGALREVIDDADEDGPSRGASTIAMQTAKNLFLWPWRSAIRKGVEIPLALMIDFVWGKRRVLEVYFNIAEWGEGVFGAEAAAQHYFQKSARPARPQTGRAARCRTAQSASTRSGAQRVSSAGMRRPSWRGRGAPTRLALISGPFRKGR